MGSPNRDETVRELRKQTRLMAAKRAGVMFFLAFFVAVYLFLAWPNGLTLVLVPILPIVVGTFWYYLTVWRLT